MEDFKLHSRGERGGNWFHFRRDLNVRSESFSITYCHDGTVCMTGDYGSLCWRRLYSFSDTPDYGFPNNKTSIDYFAEKVVKAEETQKIKTWEKDLARLQIAEAIDRYHNEDNAEYIEKLEFVLNELEYIEDGDYGHIQMLESFADGESIDFEYYYDFGITYTKTFKMWFEMLQSVSNIILEAVVIENEVKKYGMLISRECTQ